MPIDSDLPRSAPGNTGAGAIPDAKAKAQDVADRVQEQAQSAAGRTQEMVRDQVNQRSTQLGEQADRHASDLRSVSEALRQQGKDGPAQAADRIAGYAERAGGYLRGRDAETILGDLEDLGRQKPGVVAAGALAVGFAASRFLKSSSSRRYHGRDAQRPPRSSVPPREPDAVGGYRGSARRPDPVLGPEEPVLGESSAYGLDPSLESPVRHGV